LHSATPKFPDADFVFRPSCHLRQKNDIYCLMEGIKHDIQRLTEMLAENFELLHRTTEFLHGLDVRMSSTCEALERNNSPAGRIECAIVVPQELP